MDKDTWKRLSGKAQWDVIVALRGPDIKSSGTVKSFTTSVIRSAMGTIMRVGGQLSDYGFVVLPDGRVFQSTKGEGPATLRIDLDHFCGHVAEASEILGIPVIRISPPKWEEIILIPDPMAAMVQFLKYVKEGGVYIPEAAAPRVNYLMEQFLGSPFMGEGIPSQPKEPPINPKKLAPWTDLLKSKEAKPTKAAYPLEENIENWVKNFSWKIEEPTALKEGKDNG